MRSVSDESCRRMKTQITCSHFFFFFLRKSCRLWEDVGKYCRAGQDTVTIWRMRIACWIPEATKTHSQYLLLFHCDNGCKKAPRCYVVRTVAVLLIFTSKWKTVKAANECRRYRPIRILGDVYKPAWRVRGAGSWNEQIKEAKFSAAVSFLYLKTWICVPTSVYLCCSVAYLCCSVVYLCCSMYCLCVNVYCHRVTTQLQLTNISISV